MSSLLSRILLAMLMLPAASLVYLVSFVVSDHQTAYYSRGWGLWLLSGGVTSAFVGIYWTVLWRKSVRWTSARVKLTVVSVVAAIFAGMAAGEVLRFVLGGSLNGFVQFIGPVVPPLAWLILTSFIWRETAAERAQRVRGGEGGNRQAIVCPACGYNLTGLTSTRCPECGAQYTVDE